jgi:hypothetical protein
MKIIHLGRGPISLLAYAWRRGASGKSDVFQGRFYHPAEKDGTFFRIVRSEGSFTIGPVRLSTAEREVLGNVVRIFQTD